MLPKISNDRPRPVSRPYRPDHVQKMDVIPPKMDVIPQKNVPFKRSKRMSGPYGRVGRVNSTAYLIGVKWGKKGIYIESIDNASNASNTSNTYIKTFKKSHHEQITA